MDFEVVKKPLGQLVNIRYWKLIEKVTDGSFMYGVELPMQMSCYDNFSGGDLTVGLSVFPHSSYLTVANIRII